MDLSTSSIRNYPYTFNETGLVEGNFKVEIDEFGVLTSNYKDKFEKRFGYTLSVLLNGNVIHESKQALYLPNKVNKLATPVTNALENHGGSKRAIIVDNSTADSLHLLIQTFFDKSQLKETVNVPDDSITLAVDIELDSAQVYHTTLRPSKSKPQIFERNVVVPYTSVQENPFTQVRNRWEQSEDLSKYPVLSTNQPILDAMYRLSLEELEQNIMDSGTYAAGKFWQGTWTRDISYAILLSTAFLDPETSKKSLLKKVSNGRIIQDTGTGGSWPVSTDRIVWAWAAYEIYQYTGDKEWRDLIYPILQKSIETDEKISFNPLIGLFHGETSFMDWREQSYPRWMNPVDIYQSFAFNTNVLFLKGYFVLADLAEETNNSKEAKVYRQKARDLEKTILKHFRTKDTDLFSMYLSGDIYPIRDGKYETLGNMLYVLLDDLQESDVFKAQMVKSLPVSPYGIPTFQPTIKDIPSYHNKGIWPFVVGYYGWAGNKTGNLRAVDHAIVTIQRQALLFATNKENINLEDGSLQTELNSDRQLWSVAANLATIYRMILGMQAKPDGLYFNPLLPERLKGGFEIKGFRYREAVLDIKISGYGGMVKAFKLDGQKLRGSNLDATIKGNHLIEIEMQPQSTFSSITKAKILEAHPNPKIVRLSEDEITWIPKPDYSTTSVGIYKNGELDRVILDSSYRLPKPKGYQEIRIQYISTNNKSSLSAPILRYPIEAKFETSLQEGPIRMQASNDGQQVALPLPEEPGTYRLEVLYANGNGDVTTDNNCAIRGLFNAENRRLGTIVMPQIAPDDWSTFQYSSPLKIVLEKEDQLYLAFQDIDKNMDEGNLNEALIKGVRFIKVTN